MTRIDEQQFLDPRWRLSNLYTITDKAGRRVPFRPNTAQLALLDELHSANIILDEGLKAASPALQDSADILRVSTAHIQSTNSESDRHARAVPVFAGSDPELS